MQRLHIRTLKMAGLYIGVLLVAVLYGPLGWAFINALQVASLPSFLSGLVIGARASLFFAFLPWGFLLISSPVLVILLVLRKRYRFLPLWASVCAICWGAKPVVKKLDYFWEWRRAGLQRITKRAQPLIQAIDSYCTQEKRCPQQLEDLVPEYISEIPVTSAVAYPDFRYLPPGQSAYNESYELQVRTPIAGINWDVFVYWPDEKYPQKMHGGVVERIENWAYVHE